MCWRAAVLMMALAATCFADSLAAALRSGRFQDALALSDKMLELQPRDARIWTARGFALQGLQREADSIASFEKALSFAPEFVPALKGAAESCYRSRDRRTRSFLDRLLKLEPGDPVAHGMAGVLAFEGGDCSTAVTHFECSRPQTESNPDAALLYGTCLTRLHRPGDAIPLFQGLLRTKSNPIVLRALSAAQFAAHRTEEAWVSARKAISIAPEDEQTYVDLAAAFLLNDADLAAQAVVQMGLERLPTSSRLHALRGVAEAIRGDDEAAARDFENANRLDPAAGVGSAGLGVLYTDAHREADALAVLRRRLEQTPNDATLHYLLAATLARNDPDAGSPEFNEAERALVQAIRLRPDYAAAHTALATLVARSGDQQQAIVELRLALKYDPADRAALSRLSVLLRRSGRTSEAVELRRQLKEAAMREIEDTDRRSLENTKR